MKRTQKFIAMIIALLMFCSLLPATVLAASWNPDDEITITVRVFDQNSGAYYVIGTDTCTKGDQYIQSNPYKIPEISEFTSNSYGRVTKVVGNWYFPSGDSSVGATVNWSCNSSTATMTYWVTNWSTGTGSGSGSDGSDNENIGSGSTYSWKETIVYHSNYPNGTDYTHTITYTIRSYSVLYNEFSFIKSLAECGFSTPDGYIAVTPTWNTEPDGTGSNKSANDMFTFKKENAGNTTHFYAQWKKDTSGGTITEPVTLTYKDGNATISRQEFLKGDEATAVGYEKEGYIFKGWDTDSSADIVIYKAGDTFTINEDKTLYAVLEEEEPEPVDVTLTYMDEDEILGSPTYKQGETVTVADYTDYADEKLGFIFIGWDTDSSADNVVYKDGDNFIIVKDTILYAVFEAKDPDPVDEVTVTYMDGEDEIFKDTVQDGEVEVRGYDKEGFIGWSDDPDATEPEYKPGETITGITENIILYAVFNTSTDPDPDDEKTSEPGMDKKADGKDEIGYRLPGETINFTLNSHIGQDMEDIFEEQEDGTYKIIDGAEYTLTFHDKMSDNLIFNEDSVKVTLTVKGQTYELTDKQYKLITNPDDECTFEVVIDCIPLYKEGRFTYEEFGLIEVVVSYSATVAEDAKVGDDLTNAANVNDSATDVTPGTVKPEPPHTGGSGTVAFTVIGVAVMCVAGVALVFGQKKKKGHRD